VGDLDAARTFYTAALVPFGYRLVYDGERSLGWGVGEGGDDDEPFAVDRRVGPIAGTHVAFTATSPVQVDEFHAAALAAGGRDNGAPGERPYGDTYDAAFVLDPDGYRWFDNRTVAAGGMEAAVGVFYAEAGDSRLGLRLQASLDEVGLALEPDA